MAEHHIYILAGHMRGPVFIASTRDLETRLRQHRSGRVSQSQSRIDRLVYTETYGCALKAAARVNALRSASREWLDSLISAGNPAWQDVSTRLCQEAKAA